MADKTESPKTGKGDAAKTVLRAGASAATGPYFTELLLTCPAAQKASTVLDGSGAKIAEHLSEQIEHGGGFENHRVTAGRKLLRMRRHYGLAGRAGGERGRIESLRVADTSLCPAIVRNKSAA